MCDERVVDGLVLQLYGFKGNKWVRAYEKTFYEKNTPAFGMVPDKFELSNVKDWKSRSSPYSDYDVTYKLILHNGEKIPLEEREDTALPYKDKNLYLMVEEALGLAEILDIKVNFDSFHTNYSVDRLTDLMDGIYKIVYKQDDMLGLLKGKDIYKLLEELSERNNDNSYLKHEADKLKIENQKLKDEVEALRSNKKQLESCVEDWKAAVHKLQSERKQYEQNVVKKLQEAIANM